MQMRNPSSRQCVQPFRLCVAGTTRIARTPSCGTRHMQRVRGFAARRCDGRTRRILAPVVAPQCARQTAPFCGYSCDVTACIEPCMFV